MDATCDTVREQHWDSVEEPRTALTQSEQASLDAGAPPAAEAVWQQKAEKWKARCHRLQQDMNALSVEAAARDAALQVRPTGSRNSTAEGHIVPRLGSSSCGPDHSGDLHGSCGLHCYLRTQPFTKEVCIIGDPRASCRSGWR